jgi:hypothetical protein
MQGQCSGARSGHLDQDQSPATSLSYLSPVRSDSFEAELQHEVAELKAAFPRIATVAARLDEVPEYASRRFSVRLDIRWPEHQTLACGPACMAPLDALHAAFAMAKGRL